jgi:hypothetical protein
VCFAEGEYFLRAHDGEVYTVAKRDLQADDNLAEVHAPTMLYVRLYVRVPHARSRV